MYFFDYHPHFWSPFANGIDAQRKAQNIPYLSASGPLQGSRASYDKASKGTGLKEEMWPVFDGSGLWFQFHGSNPISTITATTMNCLHRSEKTTGTGSPTTGYEVMGSHRGIYTTNKLHKAMRFAAPIWSNRLGPESMALTKTVLLVTTAGCVSQQ